MRPTIIVHNSTEEPGFKDEIFGPVLSVLQVASAEEAIAIENANRYGNAASIYTSVGAHAEWFSSRFRAGMIGVNIGVPVPRYVCPPVPVYAPTTPLTRALCVVALQRAVLLRRYVRH